MRTPYSPESHRNMGFWNNATQQALNDTEIAIAGTGGTGNFLGMALARVGVQRFHIADPETFDVANSNRVMGARVDTIGRNKAEVLKEDILAINPGAQVTTYTMGINEDNISEFLRSADLAINGTELTMPQLGTMLSREARSRHVNGELSPISVLDVEYVGHGAQGTSFGPRGVTFEEFMGIEGGNRAPLDEVADQVIDPSRYLVYIPPYGDLTTLKEMRDGASLPSNMLGATAAVSIGMAETLKHVRQRVGERGAKPVYAPRVRWHDSYTNRSGETRHPQFSYYRGIARVAVNNLLRLHEPASYRKSERFERGDTA